MFEYYCFGKHTTETERRGAVLCKHCKQIGRQRVIYRKKEREGERDSERDRGRESERDRVSEKK